MSIQNISLPPRSNQSSKRPRRHGVGPKGEPQQIKASGDAVQVVSGSGLPGPGTTVSFGGNPIIMDARVALIFYGSAWNDLSLSPNCVNIQSAVQTVLATPYLSVLRDYECNGAGMDTAWNRIITNPPGNPFDGNDAGDRANDLIDNFYSGFPAYNRPNFYAFFLPPGVALELSGENGVHSNDGNVYYSWQLYGPLDTITTTFTHELVEAMTDPDGNGWQVDPRNDTSWNEIADVCNGAALRVNGVMTAAYFSTSYKACVVPQPDPPPPPPPTLPNGEYQITAGLMESHNDIPFIAIIGGTFNGKPWAMFTTQAIKRVQDGSLKFFTEEGGERAEVKIGHSLVAAFLTTDADSTKANNLDVIVKKNPLLGALVFWE